MEKKKGQGSISPTAKTVDADAVLFTFLGAVLSNLTNDEPKIAPSRNTLQNKSPSQKVFV